MKKILYVTGREATYSRTRIVFKALKAQGYEVVGCFPPDRSMKHYPKLVLRAARLARDCDVIVVGFYGQLILPFIKLLTGKPILFDMYIATFDTMINDRGAAKPGSLKAWIYKMSDVLSCRMSKRLVLETQDHIHDFAEKFNVPEEKFGRVFLAVDTDSIYPRKVERDPNQFLVHFHGEYAPFHGVKTILKAAKLLQDDPAVRFQIIGKGITYEADMKLAAELDLPNVTFYEPVPYDTLAEFMARADVCLGFFGDNDRTLRVLTNKVIEAIAMARPLITCRNEPVQELLKHGESVYLVERANPEALADAIRTLKADDALRQNLAENGHRVFLENCTLEKLGNGFANLLKDMERHD